VVFYFGLSAEQNLDVWRRWKAGQTLHEIGRAFGKDHNSIRCLVSRYGGIAPATLRGSLTWDRGLEMAKHKDFTVATDVKVYFCDPQSPWQRGSNENTNGLLRQYFPKKTDLSDYSQSDLNKVALRLNQRPRETLGFQTPASKLQESVASTH
jgi:IS30 family transposase